jgi:hypothetical protein
MRLDHLSYAAGSEGLASCVQRIGSQLGAGFSDGGLHPRFGTRNFLLSLNGGVYLEIVEALDHPAAEAAPFGRAVRARTAAGGGWLGWVVSVPDLAPVEERLGRPAASGHRIRPDGYDLRWKQIGVNDTAADPQLPFFIHWESEFLGGEATASLASLKVKWVAPEDNDGDTGIVAAHFTTPRGVVVID